MGARDLHRRVDPAAFGRRDKATVEAGPLGSYTGTIVHDRLAMYFNYGAGHVLCNAHILRSLNELLANHRHRRWAQGFIDLIIDTKRRADAARPAGKPQLTAYRQRQIRKRWDDLCDQAARAAPPATPGTQLYGTNKDARLLAVALTTHRDLFLAYTRDLTLPFDNNQAERDLRMIKLQAKISGEFRSPTGALVHHRRLRIDYERDPAVTAGFVWAAQARILLRRLA